MRSGAAIAGNAESRPDGAAPVLRRRASVGSQYTPPAWAAAPASGGTAAGAAGAT